MKSKTTAMTTVGLLLFALVAVGLPSSFFISKACQPTGVSEFFSDIPAYFSSEGC